MNSHLISFDVTTDIHLAPEGRGPILTAIRELKPKSVTLSITEAKSGASRNRTSFMEDSGRVVYPIEGAFPKIHVQRWPMSLLDPADHYEIYPSLCSIARDIVNEFPEVAVAISSGTPSMQVSWTLLAESGEVALKLFRTSDQDISNHVIRLVKLEVGLPRFIGLEQQNQKLARSASSLEKAAFKQVRMNVSNGMIHIGDGELNLSRRQLTSCRYFLTQSAEGTTLTDSGLNIRNGRISKGFSRP